MAEMKWRNYNSGCWTRWTLQSDSASVLGFVDVRCAGEGDIPSVAACRPAQDEPEPVMEKRTGFRSVEDAKAWVMDVFIARRSASELKRDAIERELLGKVRELWTQLVDDKSLSMTSAWFGDSGCKLLTVRRSDLKRTSPEALAKRYYRAYFQAAEL